MPLTSGIQYWGVNLLVKLIALAKFITVGQEITPKTPNIAYPVSLWPSLKNVSNRKKTFRKLGLTFLNEDF